MMANQNNNYPMKEWHFEHMQKMILKYVSGLTENEKQSSWKVKQHKRYGGNLPNVRRNIDFDILHGVTREEVSEFLDKIQNDSTFSDIRRVAGSIERIKDLKKER
ncbi:MAG TPA: hypothetical protein VE573_15105 [Nitrososphaeraceae archaeon]|jgi:hypothetical protein|nr:hypothetical protein [Nitrososphaeraceae archaeon]